MKRLFIILSIAVFVLSASTVFAGTTYTVKNGDSLAKIAKKHHIKESELKEANNLKSSKLSIGMELAIPDKNLKNKAAAKDSFKKTAVKTENSDNSSYTVKKGDTLARIAKKYSLTEKELKKINNITTNKLKPGQELLVKNIENAPQNPKKEKASQAGPELKTYTVKRKDNIWRLAKKFDLTVEELKEINGLTGNSIKAGQKLLVTKKSEDLSDSDNDIKSIIKVAYDRKTTPVISSARIQEVKELSASDDLTKKSMSERLILFAKKMLHLPYQFGGNGGFGIDCSSYVQKVYSIAGLSLPRTAREQFRVGESIDKEELVTGDLVFFRTYASFPSHVGIYLGNNLFIHASSRSKKVTIDSLEEPYYVKRFIGAKRLVAEEETKTIEPPKSIN